jgi:Flp pilus assembly pilin Flp
MSKSGFWSGLVPVLLGVVLVAGMTAVQGLLTDRWTGRNVAEDLKQAAEKLESKFPSAFGEWQFVQELASDPKQLERAGAVGHISRLFVNKETGAKVSAFIVCATPHDASGHTPDRCYPGAGFEIAEQEHRQSIPLADGRTAETFTGTFRKTGQTLRVFWTYGVDGQWIAPQIARIELAGTSAVYKLYAIIDETRLPGGQATVVCADFLAALLPAFDEAIFGETTPPEPEKTAATEADKRG